MSTSTCSIQPPGSRLLDWSVVVLGEWVNEVKIKLRVGKYSLVGTLVELIPLFVRAGA